MYVFDLGLGSEVVLLCSSCNQSFLHPWDLLVHVQKNHSLHIFDETADGLKGPGLMVPPGGFEPGMMTAGIGPTSA